MLVLSVLSLIIIVLLLLCIFELVHSIRNNEPLKRMCPIIVKLVLIFTLPVIISLWYIVSPLNVAESVYKTMTPHESIKALQLCDSICLEKIDSKRRATGFNVLYEQYSKNEYLKEDLDKIFWQNVYLTLSVVLFNRHEIYEEKEKILLEEILPQIDSIGVLSSQLRDKISYSINNNIGRDYSSYFYYALILVVVFAIGWKIDRILLWIESIVKNHKDKKESEKLKHKRPVKPITHKTKPKIEDKYKPINFYQGLISDSIEILKKHFPPGYLYTDYDKWNSSRPENLRTYLKYVNAVMRMEGKYIIPVIMHTDKPKLAGYTYNNHGSWIYIHEKLSQPGYEYSCFYTLIHEYMHHFLRIHNLAIKEDTIKNEVLTDCAVDYFGFSDIFRLGRKNGNTTYGYIEQDIDFKFLQDLVKQEREKQVNKMKEYWTTF